MRLISIFNTLFCGLWSRVANNRINTVLRYGRKRGFLYWGSQYAYSTKNKGGIFTEMAFSFVTPQNMRINAKIILIWCPVTEILTKEGFTIMSAFICILGVLHKDDRVASFRLLKNIPQRYENSKKSIYRRYCKVLQKSGIWQPDYVDDNEELCVAWLAKFFCSHHCRLGLPYKDFLWTLGSSWRARWCVCHKKRF